MGLFDALRAGVIPVPVNTLLTPDLVQYVLEDSRAEAILLPPSESPGLRTEMGMAIGIFATGTPIASW